MKKLRLAVAISLLVATNSTAQNSGIHLLKTFHIQSPGGWDYMAVGPVNDWIYVSHGTQVNILNKNTGDSAGVIENTTGVHGIAFDVADKKGFTSNGRLNNVTVFDLNTNKVLAQIPTGANPDAIMYDPYTNRVITCNGRSKNLSILDPVNNTIVDSVALEGRPEEAVSDGKGTVYVNLEDKNQIAAIDMKSLKVLHYWSLSPGEGPTGIAYDAKTKRLFAGCDKLLVILDAESGTIIDKVPIGDGCDGVAFDPGTNNIYTSNGEGTMTVIHEKEKSTFDVVDTITTKRSARTIALDRSSHLIYLPAAEFEALEPGQKGRPKMKPGTFQILVFGKN